VGSFLSILETLFVIKYADNMHEKGAPLLDLMCFEYGTSQLLESSLRYSKVIINMRLKRAKTLGYIKADGVDYTKSKLRDIPIANGKGRSKKVKRHLVYQLTNLGNSFLDKNSGLLEKHVDLSDLGKRLKLLHLPGVPKWEP